MQNKEALPLKYWFGYLTAAIIGAITWVLMQFGQRFSTLVDMVYPYVIRTVQGYLAQWSGSVDFLLWQVLAVFLVVVLIAALVLCIALCLVKRERPGKKDVLFGLAIGIPNYFSSRFLLLSLDSVPAMAAFPSFSVGTILLVAAAGVLLFKEKLSMRKYLALAVILGALVLLNWE